MIVFNVYKLFRVGLMSYLCHLIRTYPIFQFILVILRICYVQGYFLAFYEENRRLSLVFDVYKLFKSGLTSYLQQLLCGNPIFRFV